MGRKFEDIVRDVKNYATSDHGYGERCGCNEVHFKQKESGTIPERFAIVKLKMLAPENAKQEAERIASQILNGETVVLPRYIERVAVCEGRSGRVVLDI